MNGHTFFLPPDVKPYLPSHHGPLLHAAVGWLGKLTGASVGELYLIGRTISVVSFALTLLLLGWWVRRLGKSWLAIGLLGLLLLGNTKLLGHLVSYRPDHWVQLISVLCCVLVTEFPKRYWAWALLILLPTPAFLIKPAAGGLTVIVIAAMLLQKQWRGSITVGVGAIFVMLLTLGSVAYFSNGMYLKTMLNGLNMPLGLAYVYACLSQPEVWLGALLPLAFVRWAWQGSERQDKRVRVIWLFWLSELIIASICALRSGSNVYYFLNTVTYASLLLVMYLPLVRVVDCKGPSQKLCTGFGQLFCIAALLGLAVTHTQAGWALLGQPDFEIADRITRRFEICRPEVARWINQEKLICYSDDASLNVLLDQAQVMSPLVHTTLIQGGELPLSTMLDPVTQQEYDVMVMTGMTWSYLGMMIPPKDLLDTTLAQYRMLPRRSDSDYVYFVRRRGLVITVPPIFVAQP